MSNKKETSFNMQDLLANIIELIKIIEKIRAEISGTHLDGDMIKNIDSKLEKLKSVLEDLHNEYQALSKEANTSNLLPFKLDNEYKTLISKFGEEVSTLNLQKGSDISRIFSRLFQSLRKCFDGFREEINKISSEIDTNKSLNSISNSNTLFYKSARTEQEEAEQENKSKYTYYGF